MNDVDLCRVGEDVRTIAPDYRKSRARKEYTCRECGRTIVRGQLYMSHSGITEDWSSGRLRTFPWRVKICLECDDNWCILLELHNSSQWVFGCLQDLILDAMNFGSLDKLDLNHPFWATGMAERWHIYRDEGGDAYYIPK